MFSRYHDFVFNCPYFSFFQLIFPGKENYTDTTASEGDVFHSIPGCPSPEIFLDKWLYGKQ